MLLCVNVMMKSSAYDTILMLKMSGVGAWGIYRYYKVRVEWCLWESVREVSSMRWLAVKCSLCLTPGKIIGKPSFGYVLVCFVVIFLESVTGYDKKKLYFCVNCFEKCHLWGMFRTDAIRNRYSLSVTYFIIIISRLLVYTFNS